MTVHLQLQFTSPHLTLSDPAGRPCHMWLRAIKSDLRPLNTLLSYAWKTSVNFGIQLWTWLFGCAQEENAIKREDPRVINCDALFLLSS